MLGGEWKSEYYTTVIIPVSLSRLAVAVLLLLSSISEFAFSSFLLPLSDGVSAVIEEIL